MVKKRNPVVYKDERGVSHRGIFNFYYSGWAVQTFFKEDQAIRSLNMWLLFDQGGMYLDFYAERKFAEFRQQNPDGAYLDLHIWPNYKPSIEYPSKLMVAFNTSSIKLEFQTYLYEKYGLIYGIRQRYR
ncbi:hypothetical protein HGH91_05395 [Chitinophaga eiseniae]|uniref:Uncharacterized protein n=1 Tax=Chitinophaga eiseniae TaxID=634771 RepID=A0A847SKH8_9BACT|nr:hypothetical protein [Chitinophaga eiseniae]